MSEDYLPLAYTLSLPAQSYLSQVSLLQRLATWMKEATMELDSPVLSDEEPSRSALSGDHEAETVSHEGADVDLYIPGGANGTTCKERRKCYIINNKGSTCLPLSLLIFVSLILHLAADAEELFILTLAKALLVLGGPTHKIEPQLASVDATFGLPAQFAYLLPVGSVLASFDTTEGNVQRTHVWEVAEWS